MSKPPISTKKVIAGLVGAIALSFGTALAANAHVHVSSTSNEENSTALLTFDYSHGCGESPTNSLTFQIPEPIIQVTPAVKPGWEVEIIKTPLATPYDNGHGGQVTERISEVIYTTKTPVINGLRDTAQISVKLPEGTAGTEIAFPVIQGCVEGENAWIQTAANGEDAHSLDYPAPVLKVVPASSASPEDHSHNGSDDNHAANSNQSSANGEVLAIVGIVLGTVAALLAVFGLFRSKRQAKN